MKFKFSLLVERFLTLVTLAAIISILVDANCTYNV